MKLTNSMKTAGELAVRMLSEKAQKLYYGTDPFDVYKYENDGENLYAYTGAFGEAYGLTFQDLNNMLESIASEVDDDD